MTRPTRFLCVPALAIAVLLGVVSDARAQDKPNILVNGTSTTDAEQAVRERLQSYVEAFNMKDAAAVAAYWTADGLSVAEETGQRTQGREALQEEFSTFFEANPSARLTGEANHIRFVTANVAMVEGHTTLFVTDAEPVETAFSAVLVKDSDQWLISSSHERDLPVPATSYDALKELDWLLGTWEDQSEGAQVATTVSWSPNRAFLLRSFAAEFASGEALHGTQVIGWDPLSQQIRTWTFNSDGSFGQGTLSKHDEDWLLKMWQILPDGRLASATKALTRIDRDTMTVQTIAETIDGEPSPSSGQVTVVRTASPEAAAGPAEADPEGETP
jgi:uncharacterized protein (TIGR02246 family)